MSRRACAVLAVVCAVVAGGPAAASAAGAAGAPVQPTWHFEQAGVPDVGDAGRGGEGVVVAVLDSWVDGSHPDFEGRVLPGGLCSRGRCEDGEPARDGCEHGTHVAGTVASSSYGVAPRARVLPVRVLSYVPATGDREASCSGTTDDVAAGIRYAVRRGARVVNLSIGAQVPGLSSSARIGSAVAEAADAGAVVVVAAGNSNLPLAESYGDDALVVAATGPDGSLASYSRPDPGVTLAAPGGEALGEECTPAACVTSLFPGGGYALAAGTSMAAPHVAGAAALLLGQDPRRTRDEVVQRLLATARPVRGGRFGLLDAAAALGGRLAVTEPTPAVATGEPVPATSSAPAPADAVPAAPGPAASGRATPGPAAPGPAAPGPAAPVPAAPVPGAPASPSPPTAARPAAPQVPPPVPSPAAAPQARPVLPPAAPSGAPQSAPTGSTPGPDASAPDLPSTAREAAPTGRTEAVPAVPVALAAVLLGAAGMATIAAATPGPGRRGGGRHRAPSRRGG